MSGIDPYFTITNNSSDPFEVHTFNRPGRVSTREIARGDKLAVSPHVEIVQPGATVAFFTPPSGCDIKILLSIETRAKRFLRKLGLTA